MENQNLQSRPPIVTILGHVDHGKTSLLDAIRKTNVVAREAGGITQTIGASVIKTKEGRDITFIDTPGHAAFSNMRSRGSKVADIAILIVDATDGVKPQTQESIKLILEAKIPFIVVATKMDLPTATKELVYAGLENEGIYFEGRGGDTPLVEVSAKKGEGISQLLEMILLIYDMQEVKADKEANLQAVVIETQTDKRGSLASVVVRDGSLKVGDTVYCEDKESKIRGLFNDQSVSVKEVLPGYPAAIMGLEALPQVGTIISSTPTVPGEKAEAAKKDIRFKLKKDEIAVYIKAKNQGTLEAVLANLTPKAIVVGSGVGDVFESDILTAKSSGGANIFCFESKASPQVAKLADAEGIKIESFNIIYELFQRIEELLKSGQKEVLGKAEVIASFPFNNKKVAGCKLTLGKMVKNDSLLVMRGEKEIGRSKATSLKKGKADVLEVKQGEEFGVIFEPQLDFAIGDVLVSVAK